MLNPKEKTASDGQLPSHDTLEDFLGRYCGLMLFVKEIDQSKYQQICAVSSRSSRLQEELLLVLTR